MERKKVMIGMSGGVDSSVAALLLKQAGHQVAGVTFRLWDAKGSREDPNVRDAKTVCQRLGIPHFVLDFRDLFRESVVEYFRREYEAGRTPNPCVACNRSIKFGAFLEKAREMGYDTVATGHYAQLVWDERAKKYLLRPGKIEKKDQSYVLYMLTQEQLSHILMPIGGYSKEEVRQIAKENGLVVADKPDSQDICFVPGGDHAAFLKEYTGRSGAPGNFVDPSGRVLGPHEGLWNYTIGQRKGLGLSLNAPAFVSGIDAATGAVTVTTCPEELMSLKVLVGKVNWMMGEPPAQPVNWKVKIRYAHHAAQATVTPLENSGAQVEFDSPQRAVTPGQAAVFYTLDGTLMGGGTIL